MLTPKLAAEPPVRPGVPGGRDDVSGSVLGGPHVRQKCDAVRIRIRLKPALDGVHLAGVDHFSIKSGGWFNSSIGPFNCRLVNRQSRLIVTHAAKHYHPC